MSFLNLACFVFVCLELGIFAFGDSYSASWPTIILHYIVLFKNMILINEFLSIKSDELLIKYNQWVITSKSAIISNLGLHMKTIYAIGLLFKVGKKWRVEILFEERSLYRFIQSRKFSHHQIFFLCSQLNLFLMELVDKKIQFTVCGFLSLNNETLVVVSISSIISPKWKNAVIANIILQLLWCMCITTRWQVPYPPTCSS